jgi:peptide/nickel transport system substrate-binding protein
MSFTLPGRPIARFALSVAALSLTAVVLAGCAGEPSAGDSAKPVSGGTLTYASGDAEPTCLDPHVGGNYPQALVGTQFLESLVSQNKKAENRPGQTKTKKHTSESQS